MLKEFITNKVVITAFIAWATAQILKTITHAIVYKKIDFKRLLGDGGMPSCHSAVVSSTALAIGLIEGFHSAVVSSTALAIGLIEGFNTSLFALAAVVAIVVMHDASGVRLETGKQAKIIKDMSQFIESLNNIKFDDESLKEFVGHTHLQVFMGAILGIIVALIINL